MRIGVVIGRIGGIDGVALETEKWITVLSRLGHEVRLISGALEGEVAAPVTLLPELAFDHPFTVEEQRRAFLAPDPAALPEEVLLAELLQQAARIEAGLERWVEAEGIHCLVPENACALPCHLTMGMAIFALARRLDLPAVTHDHDFWWERGARYASPYPGITAIVERCFPLRLPRVRHAVINRAARDTLRRRHGIDDALVVPNVMDFSRPFGARDAENADLRAELGLDPADILLFQITRIVRRKGIDIAIDLVHRLADPRVKLLITGTAVDDDDGTLAELQAQVERLGLQGQVLFAGHRFDNQRKRGPGGEKVYALADGYAHADACTYFSSYEGFGNAFVEAVAAGVPVLVNNYRPVYWPDIGSFGFKTVMIEDGKLTDAAVAETRALLGDPAQRARWAAHNTALGRKHFSLEALERLLGPLFSSL